MGLNSYSSKKDVYEEKCFLIREETGVEAEAEVLYFLPKVRLKVALGKVISVVLHYEPSIDRYIGGKSGIHFLSSGPSRLK